MSAEPWPGLPKSAYQPAGELPSPLRQVPAAVLVAPEGTPLLLSSNA